MSRVLALCFLLLATVLGFLHLDSRPTWAPFVIEPVVALEEQVVVIYAGVKGYLDKVPVKEVTKFENDFLQKLRNSHPEILNSIKKEQKIISYSNNKIIYEVR
jgi:hypothetical protein